MGEVPCANIKERILGELVQGETMANQLKALLQDPGNIGSNLALDLVTKILGSFTESLSALGSRDPPEGGSKMRSADSKEKRGYYDKRRNSCQTRTRVASTIEDDHSWRKYGQKMILNSKYPRSYFRCTHNYDQDCKAIKQVQKMEEKPRTYEITYIGVHTCKNGKKEPSPPPRSFDAVSSSDSLNIKDDLLLDCSSTGVALVVKEEDKSEITDIDIDSLLMGAGDFPGGSSKYQGYEMDFLMDHESSNLSMFGY